MTLVSAYLLRKQKKSFFDATEKPFNSVNHIGTVENYLKNCSSEDEDLFLEVKSPVQLKGNLGFLEVNFIRPSIDSVLVHWKLTVCIIFLTVCFF